MQEHSAERRRVAIVTGAGSGIGRATAVALSERGFNVALVGRREGTLAETAGLLAPGAEVLTIVADISDAAEVERLVGAVLGRFGRVDALVNNAGHAPSLPIERTTPGVIRETYGVNAIGPAMLIAALWPTFVRQGEAQGGDPAARRGGCIVNLSTMGTVDPFPGFFAYAASKAAVNLMARSCANEGKPWGIRAFAVAPGAVETPMLRSIFPESAIPRERCLAPEEVARVIVGCVVGERDGENGETILLPGPQPPAATADR